MRDPLLEVVVPVTFLLVVGSVVLLAWGLVLVLGRLLGRRPAPGPSVSGDAAPGSPPSPGWTRQDRLALASLVVGVVLGVLALLSG